MKKVLFFVIILLIVLFAVDAIQYDGRYYRQVSNDVVSMGRSVSATISNWVQTHLIGY